MKRRHCSPSYHQDNLYNDVCDVSYETICTTIIATKYVKVSVALSFGNGGSRCYYRVSKSGCANIKLSRLIPLTDDHIYNTPASAVTTVSGGDNVTL